MAINKFIVSVKHFFSEVYCSTITRKSTKRRYHNHKPPTFMESIYIRPGLSVEEDDAVDTFDRVVDGWGDYLASLFDSTNFLYLFIFQLLVLLYTSWCFYRNRNVVALASTRLHPPVIFFYYILGVVCIIPALVTHCCLRERINRMHVWYAFILYDLALILWCSTVLFERLNKGTGMVFAFILLLASVWYIAVTASVNYKYLPCTLILIWCTTYLFYYAYNLR